MWYNYTCKNYHIIYVNCAKNLFHMIAGTENVADILTKPTVGPTFNRKNTIDFPLDLADVP